MFEPTKIGLRKVWIATGVALALFLPTAHAVSARHTKPAPTVTYVVRPGDTLWKIAQNAGLEGDMRDAVQNLIELNEGLSPVLRPGQTIELPRI